MFVIISGAKQSRNKRLNLDCFAYFDFAQQPHFDFAQQPPRNDGVTMLVIIRRNDEAIQGTGYQWIASGYRPRNDVGGRFLEVPIALIILE